MRLFVNRKWYNFCRWAFCAL